MGTYLDRRWPGNPGGYTPKTRRAGNFRVYVPDLLADLDLHIPAGLADSVTNVTRQLDSLNAGQPGLEQRRRTAPTLSSMTTRRKPSWETSTRSRWPSASRAILRAQ